MRPRLCLGSAPTCSPTLALNLGIFHVSTIQVLLLVSKTKIPAVGISQSRRLGLDGLLKTLAQRGCTQLTSSSSNVSEGKSFSSYTVSNSLPLKDPPFSCLPLVSVGYLCPLDLGFALFCSWIKGVCWGWATLQVLVSSKQKAPGSKAGAIPQLETTGHSLECYPMIKYPVTASLPNWVQFRSGAPLQGGTGRKPSIWGREPCERAGVVLEHQVLLGLCTVKVWIRIR